MPKIKIRFWLAAAGLAVLASIPSSAQSTNAVSTNAPAATAPETIPLANVAVQAQAVATQLQQYQASLDPDDVLQAIGEKLPGLSRQIEDRTIEDTPLLDGSASLTTVQMSGTAWQSFADDLAEQQLDLSKRVGDLNNILWKLNVLATKWKATLDTTRNVPPEVAQRVQETITQIAATSKAVTAHLEPLYEMQGRVAAQEKVAQSGLDSIKKAIDKALTDLFQRNHPPLWDPQSFTYTDAGTAVNEGKSFESQIDSVKSYLQQRIGVGLIQLFLLVILVMAFFWIRNTIHSRARQEVELRRAAQIFDDPLATALLLALLVTGFLFPHAPKLLYATAGGIALIPAAIITRRLIDPNNVPILYAAIISYLVDQVRYVATTAGVLARFVFIVELTAICIFILAMLRSPRMTETSTETARLRLFSRIYLHLTFIVLVSAGFANVFGYIPLSLLVGRGMLTSSYLAILLYPAVRILDALALAALSMPPFSRLGMVRRHRELIYINTGIAIRWIMFALWFVSALEFFQLRIPASFGMKKLLWDEQIPYFALSITPGAVLAFPITIWVSFLLSRFVRFILNEEIYPHLNLSRGIPYAASTMVHYTILCLGLFAAVAATGVDLGQFTVLAGAIGVGLGFGLQNIMNNFVSGVILLFERPIKVGDTIQIDANTMGRVERIGIRASVILLSNGSEMIVPNGNLISNPVTNWTLSNCERLVEIPVTVTSKVDPQRVIDVLIKTAANHARVLKNPAPHAILATIGATLVFRLRAWIDSEDEWMKITSDLSVEVNEALTKEGLTLG